MKKKYIKPEIELSEQIIGGMLMASVEKPLGDRYGRWGNGVNNYGNDLWVNEGQGSDDLIGIEGDDNGTINSRAKGGNLWDE